MTSRNSESTRLARVSSLRQVLRTVVTDSSQPRTQTLVAGDFNVKEETLDASTANVEPLFQLGNILTGSECKMTV